MGKRELLLIGAFALVGVIVWRLTVPAPPPGQEGFSLSRWWTNVRAGMQDQQATAEVRRTGTFTAVGTARVVSVPEFRWAAARVTVTGEDRSDISAELSATVYGPDDGTARRSAEGVRLEFAIDGDVVAVRPVLPETRRRARVTLALRIPRSLGVKLVTAGDPAEIRGVAAVELDASRADVRLVGVAGAVHGEQREGELDVERAGSARLTLRRVDGRLTGIAGEATIDASDGDLLLRDVGGRLDLQGRRVSLEVERARGSARLVVSDGRTAVRDSPGSMRIEARRSPLSVSPVPAGGLDATSEDARVELLLPQAAVLDLRADGGEITVPDGVPAPTRTEGIARVQARIGAGGGPAITVRSTRGDIVARR